jgi:hypothetical protein
MTDEEREMLEALWENFFPLMDDVEDALRAVPKFGNF